MEQTMFKILIVDDSLMSLEILRSMLLKNSAKSADSPDEARIPYFFEIIVAMSGEEALEKAKAEKPDLIILDIILPKMSGFEVLDILKSSEETKGIPVIVISGLDNEVDEEKGLLLGAVDYVKKPFKENLVLARMSTQLKVIDQIRIIEKMSMYDTLTNIPNRQNFNIRAKADGGRAVREQTPISVLIIDIDHFKKVNDTHGHQQGDVALVKVAETIASTLRRSSDLAARWGGEEFVVLLPNTLYENAKYIAEIIRSAVEQTSIPGVDGNPPLNVTISIGVASTTPDDTGFMAGLLKEADKALYTAKETGRNKVCG